MPPYTTSLILIRSVLDQGQDPVPEPLPSWIVEEGDGQTPAVALNDARPEDREYLRPETNMIQPNRPVDLYGFLKFILSIKVAPTSKITFPIPLDSPWWQWMIDLLGTWNAGNMREKGNGFFDTGAFLSALTGGGLVNILYSIYQNGSHFDVIQTLDFRIQPIKGADGIWRHNGVVVSYKATPQLMTTRNNRTFTSIITWQTRYGVNSRGDVTNGFEHWPNVTNKVAAQPRYKLQRYPKLPFVARMYKNSLLVNGEPQEVFGGREITIDAYRFRECDTYVRSKQTKEWFLAETMIRRSGPYDGTLPATGFDWRYFIKVIGNPEYDPWMSWRSSRCPEFTWQRI